MCICLAIKERTKFRAKLIEHAGTKIETRTITTEQYAKDIVAGISGLEQAKIRKITKNKKKNPTAPFITSSLQIEASRQLGLRQIVPCVLLKHCTRVLH